MLWFLILIALIVLFGLGLALSNYKHEDFYECMLAIFSFILLFSVLLLVIYRVGGKAEIEKFKSIEQTIEDARATGAERERYAITAEIVKANAWLATEQYWVNNLWFNWFHLKEVNELKPIK